MASVNRVGSQQQEERLPKLTWRDVVKGALLELGGQGHLSQINKIVERHPKTRTNPTWRDTIRRVVRQYKMFQPVGPQRSGIYALVQEAPVPLEPQSLAGEPTVDHGIAQGMLVTLGGVYGYETFAPARDQTIRRFQGRSLRDFVTVTDCSDIFSGSRNLSKIREIDVLWFNEDDDGLYPSYAFEVEETTGVKTGLDRLLKIPRRFSVKFYVIAPGDKEKALFDRYVGQTPVRGFSDRFTFKNFRDLEELYNSAVVHNERMNRFGLCLSEGRNI